MLKKKKNLASYRFKALPRWPDMKNDYHHAFQNQLFLCTYLHNKRVMLLARERVITCRVRAFTLFPEIRGASQMIIPILICDRKQNQAMGKKAFLCADIHYFERLNWVCFHCVLFPSLLDVKFF